MSWRSAIGIAVLVWLVFFFNAHAHAQAQSEVWSATLTPGEISSGPNGYCGANTSGDCWVKSSHSPYGVLSDNDFMVGDRPFVVRSLRYGASGDGHLFLTLDEDLTESDKLWLTLHIGNRQFALADANDHSKGYQWQMQDPQWTVGTDIAVKLTMPSPVSNVAHSVTVPFDWPLKPPFVAPGQRFRLLFVTSRSRNAESSDIRTYNEFVQERAAAGHDAIRPYARGFRAVASTHAVDARSNVRSWGSGAHIFWLGATASAVLPDCEGALACSDAYVASNYGGFYDGNWWNECSVRNEHGDILDQGFTDQGSIYESWEEASGVRVWTGSTNGGREYWSSTPLSHALGTPHRNQVRIGRPCRKWFGFNPGPLDGGTTVWERRELPLYALSQVFVVGAEASGGQDAPPSREPLTASLESAPESHDGEESFRVRVAFSEDIATSYSVLGQGFGQSGGAITSVRRVDKRSDLWELEVQPDGDADVTLTLEGGRACSVEGVPCTGDVPPRQLENTLTVTVPGPEDENALTANIVENPSYHDGTRFEIVVAFSADLRNRYDDVPLGARAEGGTLKSAARHNGASDVWRFRVLPDGHGTVTFTLPGGGTCAEDKADSPGVLCTSDRRALSHSVSLEVPGQPAISVADAEATEGTNATMSFQVSLDKSALDTITVDYATRDGTATAGADYTAKSGTLTFNVRGSRTQTVRVTILNDEHNDDGETFKLVLSNASGARIADGEAVGTIRNADAMPQAWIARFGRTVAEHAAGAIGERLRGGAPPGVVLGGQSLALDEEFPARNGPGASTLLAGTSRALPVALDERTGEVAPSAWRALRMGDLLLASSFHLASSVDPESAPRWSLWGRGTRSSFEGAEDALSVEGDVTTATLGVDYERARWLVGAALARSAGDGTYGTAGDCDTACAGELESTLFGLYPYARYRASDKLSLWGVLGGGQGDLALTPEGGRAVETDIESSMAAAGARGVLWPASAPGGFELALRADLLVTATSSEAAAGLVKTEAETSRVRLLLEGSRAYRLGDDATLTPAAELGMRYDGGDAETGGGLEIGVSLRYAAGRLAVEVGARTLLAHSADDYEEWGVSGSVRFAPGENGRGLSMRLGSAWGAGSGGAERIWAQRLASLPEGSFDPDASLDTEVAYGLDTWRGLLTPYTGVALTGGGEVWRAGARWKLAPDSELSLEASLEQFGGDEPEGGVLLKGSKRW